MGISKGQEVNSRNLNNAFLSAVGGGTMTGNYNIIGKMTLGTAVEIRGHNDSTTGSDIYLYDDGLISSEDDLIMMIDSDNNSSSNVFTWKTNTEVDPGGSTLMELDEDGQLYMYYTGDADLATDGAIIIGDTSGINFTLDRAGIMARNNGAAADMWLNPNGGIVYIGNSTIALDSSGTITSDGDITTSTDVIAANVSSGDGDDNNSVTMGEGVIDIFHATPSIDFHYLNTASDYNVRLINDADGVLSVVPSTPGTGGTHGLRIGSSGGVLEDNETSPAGSRPLGYNGYFFATRVYNAVFNDLAEFMEYDKSYEPVPGLVMCQHDGLLRISDMRADKAVIGVYSDTYGFALGADKQEDKIPIGLAGKVKVLVCGEVQEGDELVSYEGGRAVKANIIERLFKRNCIIGKSLETGRNAKLWMLIK